jgi:ribosomal protein S8E
MMIVLVLYLSNCKQVKVWCTQQESSVINIDMKANICSVKYNPGSSMYVAVSILSLFVILGTSIIFFSISHFL